MPAYGLPEPLLSTATTLRNPGPPTWCGTRYGCRVLALVLVALSLGLDNLAASIAIGVSGASSRTRLRVGLTFGIFETATPIIGLLLGHGLAAALGHATRWIGAALLIGTGLYSLLQAAREHQASDEDQATPARTGTSMPRLLITGAAVSIDNLAVGFALSALHVSLVLAVVVIGTVSVAMSLTGLELGSRIGARTGEYGEILGGLVLIGVGIALAAGIL
jgi:manganese efflux pump family protein